ncbi:transposase [Paraburkholderia susongensis]|uniref:Transposase n=1 Tax=Paraburkholderia susongensis TaxID=1515439 RepID=A0A1X7J2X5_9BURK|nr:transposase [Paraburkholderia susongensis]SMG22035.1 Transposase [Paraburkholderia susongensis]
MFFDELNNDEWMLLAPLVSDEPAVRLNRRGRPRAEPRIVANAVLWILTTGEPWSKLPGRYPSGPTCRRRFEEWQLNGTLLEMVRLLSQTGRTFAYIPEPVPPVVAKPAAPVAPTPSTRDESLRGVSWKSPESWQAPGASNALSQWRSADPIADITRQLSGLAHAPAASAAGDTQPAPMQADPRAQQADAALDERAANPAYMTSAAADYEVSASAFARPMHALDDQRASLSMSLAPSGMQVADPRGYLIYVVVEQVPSAMYRAWAEIMKDGKRVERSGLVGPRFTDAQDAQQYALDWARQWIDRECLTQAAAAAQMSAAPAGTAVATAAASMAASAQSAPAYAPRTAARPLPALRHVPEPASSNAATNAAVNHGQPLHGPLNAFRGPLRRYPAEPPAATTGAGTVSGVSSVTADGTQSDRFSPSYKELISHVG